MKKCTVCGVAKPLSEYHKHPIAKDGRDNKCKPCKIAYVTERQKAHLKDPVWRDRQVRKNKAKNKAEDLVRMVRRLARTSSDLQTTRDAIALLESITGEDEHAHLVCPNRLSEHRDPPTRLHA